MNSNNYHQKYFKYKSKYLNLKNLIGGDPSECDTYIKINNELIRLFKNNRLNGTKKNFKVHFRHLNEDETHKDKICHHYSLFSLYNDISNCCSLDSQAFIDVLKPICIPDELGIEVCNFRNSCMVPCKSHTKILCDGCPTKKYNVRLYNKDEPTDTSFFDHSSRFENGLWWHKFNGVNALIAIESDNEDDVNFNYPVTKLIEIESYDVPNTYFKDNVDVDVVKIFNV